MSQSEQMKDDGPRSFAVFIQSLGQGDVNAELSRELHNLGKACKKEADNRGEEVVGTLTLKLKIKADPRDTAYITWDIAAVPPKPKRIGAALWINRHGNFVQSDPKQPELFPREVKPKHNHSDVEDVVDAGGGVKEV
jgi:hypothetical protein